MNRRIIKTSLISVSIILFIYILINNIIQTIGYCDNIIELLNNIFMEWLLNFSIIDVIALILLCIGIAIKTEIYTSKETLKNTNNKNTLWKILLTIGILPFATVLIISIVNIFMGFTFFFNTCYGFEAFISSIVLYSYIIWPIYIIGAIIIILSTIKIINNTNTEHKKNYE